MSGGKDITDKQKELIHQLSNKDSLTEKQQITLDELIKKRDTIELSKGAKTLLRKLRREVKFKRRREINSKYLTKGIELEEEAIDWLSLYHDTVFTNNKERRENKYFTGECDIIEGYDTKVAWSIDTLPDPEEPLPPIYEYQNRIYMMLWDKEEWTTSSIAISMLEDHIKKTIYGDLWKWKGEDIPDWRKIELIKYYCYEEEFFLKMLSKNDVVISKDSDEKTIDMFMSFIEIPMHERIVEKTIKRDKSIEKKMITIAKLARKYMQDLEDKMYLKQNL
ncbi:MAG: hypothetical protein ACW980_21780 [Promethearchaeota archaeon]